MRQINKEETDEVIYLKNIINDLVLSLNIHISGYPFDDNHITKQKELILRSYRAIGTPTTMEEMIVYLAWNGVF